jgi:PAT family beta-lactamase induction signal transducer AmpG
VSLAERRGLRLFTLSALFFAQGIPWGFLAITLPAYLAKHGVEEAALGTIFGMSYLPYAFKWLGGPLIDMVTIPRLGRRRPWIVFAQAMMAVTAGALLIVRDPVASSGLLAVLVFTHTVFNAIQNVAVDALAIDLLDPDERGRANGFMYGSKYAGGLVGGAGLGTVIDVAGFEAAIVIQIVILGAILLLPLLVKERTGAPPPHAKSSEVLNTLGDLSTMRSPWLAALSMLLASVAGGVLMVISPVLFTQQLGWQVDQYTWLTGGFGLLVGVVGSLSAGGLADLIGHRLLAAIASLVMAAGWIVFGLCEPWWHHTWFIYMLGILEPFTTSVMIVSLWSVCMSVSLKRTAATQFAAYTSLTSLSVFLGSRVLAANLHAWWDYPTIYVAAGLFQAATVVILPFIDPGQVRRELGEG